jgi:lysophospholipase L1-like esterase
VIDFEAATQDKATGSYIPADEHGDHLHPNDAGMKVMSDAIDLKLFTEK